MLHPRALPMLVAPLIACAGIMALPAEPAHAATCAYASGWGTPDRSAADRVTALVNDHRRSLGLSALGKASSLAKIAEWKSGHMAARGYFSHEDQGITVNGGPRETGARMSDCGYRGGSWAENIAAGHRSPAEVMRGWLNSPGHRRNIESPNLRSIGVGVVPSRSGQINWTQIFGDASVIDGKGGGATAAPKPKPKPKPKPTPKPATTGGLPVLSPGTLLSAKPSVRPRTVTSMRFALQQSRRARVGVKVRASKGRRPFSVRVHCNGKRVATARGRRGKAAVIRRRLPQGRCAVMVKAGSQKAPVTVSLRAG